MNFGSKGKQKKEKKDMEKKDFFYQLPEELIAQDPLTDRSSSRLMVLNRTTKEVEHRTFRDIIEYLQPKDCLVLNLSLIHI